MQMEKVNVAIPANTEASRIHEAKRKLSIVYCAQKRERKKLFFFKFTSSCWMSFFFLGKQKGRVRWELVLRVLVILIQRSLKR